MRVNVYAEELTTDTEAVHREVVQEDGTSRHFYGVRLFLESPDALHHSAYDDDRSGVTLWVPWTEVEGHDFALVAGLLHDLQESLWEAKSQAITQLLGDRAKVVDVPLPDGPIVDPDPYGPRFDVHCPYHGGLQEATNRPDAYATGADHNRAQHDGRPVSVVLTRGA